MIKHFCDVCGEETYSGKFEIVEVPCHLYSNRNEPGYVDDDSNRTSRRVDRVEMCRSCHNIVFTEVVNKILELKADIQENTE